MRAKILDGKQLAARRLAALAPRIRTLRGRRRPPVLCVVSIGRDPASALYGRQQLKVCVNAGVQVRSYDLPPTIAQTQARELLKKLGADPTVDAILVRTPLPGRMDLGTLLDSIPPEKDVEGLGRTNYGRLFSAKSFREIERQGLPIPPTPHAIIRLLLASGARVAGSRAAVLGRSNVVGKPTAHLLSCLDATVTLCHSRTRGLRDTLRASDIVVAAAGRPRFVKGSDLKRGAVVLDAGINYERGKLLGDVDADSAQRVASALTPVPGGVGPLTTAMLLENILVCARQNR